MYIVYVQLDHWKLNHRAFLNNFFGHFIPRLLPNNYLIITH